MDVVDRKILHQFHIECARIKPIGGCIGYGDMYTGCIVTVVDEGNVAAMAREKESWEIIIYYFLIDEQQLLILHTLIHSL